MLLDLPPITLNLYLTPISMLQPTSWSSRPPSPPRIQLTQPGSSSIQRQQEWFPLPTTNGEIGPRGCLTHPRGQPLSGG